MNNINTKISIDLYSSTDYKVIQAQQGDNLSRVIEFELFNNGEKYILSDGLYVKIVGTRPDNVAIYDKCTYHDSIITYTLTNSILSCSGRSTVKLVIEDKNNVILSSIPFYICVEKSPFDENKIIATPQFSVLTEAINNLNDVLDKTDVVFSEWEDSKEVIDEKMQIVDEKINDVDSSLSEINNTMDSINSDYNTIKEAESTRISNENKRISNENTRCKNESARIESENERNDNETNRNSSENDRKNNEISRSSAETLRNSNENTRKSNETKRQSDESTRNNNENTRIKSENTRISNESTRNSNETERKTNETKRVNTENARISSESSRQKEETNRSNNESERIKNEKNRTDSETERNDNESSRISNENNRVSSESTRKSNESTRISNEKTREDNETKRKTSEEKRVSSETTRNNNETNRQSNETDRKTAESIRNQNETTRQKNTQTAIENTNTAITRANKAAKSCEDLINGNLPFASKTSQGTIKLSDDLSMDSSGVVTVVGGNSDTVNNHTVQTDVPKNAVFTDTVYIHPNTHPASMITGLPTSLPANGGTSTSCSGNSATATKLKTAITINGVSFDGSKSITIDAGGYYVGSSAPSNTKLLWIDSANSGIMKYYNGSSWTAIRSVWG